MDVLGTSRFNGLVWVLVGMTVIALGSTPASGEPAGACSLLPDLRCERSGRFEGFHQPIVSPFLFEDPFVTTGLHAHYVWHEFPGRSIFGDGEIHAVAVQARIALTDRLAFVATKDGYAWKRPELELGGVNLLDDTQGFFNLSGGFKYALLQDQERGFIVSPALRIEVPSGSSDTLQGHADGVLIPSLAAAWGRGRLHLIGDLGSQIPLDGGEQSASIFYHVYAAWNLCERLVPFIQLSGLTWVHSGDGKIPVKLKTGAEVTLDTAQDVVGTGRFEGADVVNLGSRGVSGQDLWTWALGAHVPIGPHVTFALAYERPFSHQKGIFKQRVMTSLALEF